MAAAEAGRALSAEERDAVRWGSAMALLAAAGDPATAARLERNDLYRAERALEVVRATGRPMADFKPGADAQDAAPYDFRCAIFTQIHRSDLRLIPSCMLRCFHLAVPRVRLYRRIDARCEAMLAGGLLPEAAALHAQGLRPARGAGPEAASPPAARSIGYAQALTLLCALAATPRGQRARAAPQLLQACLEDMAQGSRNYAKRQHTWFRGEPRFRWVATLPGMLPDAATSAAASSSLAVDPYADCDEGDAVLAAGREGALAHILASFRAEQHAPCAAAADAPGVGCAEDKALAKALRRYRPRWTSAAQPAVRDQVSPSRGGFACTPMISS